VWGSRTLAGSNLNTDLTWRYVPVRRLTDFIEQTLVQSLRWAIFEPNGPALWASISLEVGAFMSGLYAAGAFSGATAAKAYTVACDSTTTSTADMLAGIVRVSVGFQPVEPAEFVALNIVLNAGTAAN
jgi:phage tail sheath protein FI